MRGQTKAELINKQLIAEYVIIEYDNMGGEQSRLADSLSLQELQKYSRHANPQLRLLSELILMNEHKIDFYDLLKYELAHDTIIEVANGCEISFESTSDVIYSEFDIKNDKYAQKLDSLILFSNGQISYFNYQNILEKPVNQKFIPRIEYLAFEKHNFAAFKFLLDKYAKRAHDYLLNEFYATRFETPYDKEHLAQFIIYLLNSKDEKLRKIGITAIKDKDWCCSPASMILEKLLNEIKEKEK